VRRRRSPLPRTPDPAPPAAPWDRGAVALRRLPAVRWRDGGPARHTVRSPPGRRHPAGPRAPAPLPRVVRRNLRWLVDDFVPLRWRGTAREQRAPAPAVCRDPLAVRLPPRTARSPAAQPAD